MTDLIDELRGSLRLRLGLAAIVAIACLYGLLEWRDAQALQVQAYRREAMQLLRVEGQQSQQQWLTRAVEAKEALERARDGVWVNVSVGRAQAQVQDWLAAVMRQTAAQAASVKVAEGDIALDASGVAPVLPEALKDLVPLRARVEFATDERVLMAVLATVNDADQRVIVDTLAVKPGRTEIGLTFWFRLPLRDEGSSAAKAKEQGA